VNPQDLRDTATIEEVAVTPDTKGTEQAIQSTARQMIGQLCGLFKEDPTSFQREAELVSRLSVLLARHPSFALGTPDRTVSLVRQEYPTPFKCQMGDLRFEVLDDSSRGKRGRYDLVVLNPWWVDKAPPKAVRSSDFALFRREIRDGAQPQDAPLCLAGIEIYLVRAERPTLADYSRIGQDYRKLLLSGTLSSGWRFMDRRYMLVFSQHSQPHEAKWRQLVESSWQEDVDPRNAWLLWTSPQGTRSSG
jgi:hypothetical protein